MKTRIVIILIAMASLIAGTGNAADFKIIVNSSNPIDSVSSEKLADIFLKKQTRWDSGHSISPVDQSERSPVRDQFTRGGLHREVAWIEGYWQKMIFSGRATPPAMLNTDAEVIEFVRNNPDAIGYVADATPLGPNLKTISVKE